MLNLKTLVFLGLFTVLFASGSELRFLQEESEYKLDAYIQGKIALHGSTLQIKDKHICLRAGSTPKAAEENEENKAAHAKLMANLEVDADGDQCLPLICVENIFQIIKTKAQEIRFLCNTHGNSGIEDRLRVRLIFRLDRANKMKVSNLSTKVKEARASCKIQYNDKVSQIEEKTKVFNTYSIRWIHRKSEKSELLEQKKALEDQLKEKREELKKLEQEYNKKHSECMKEQNALIEFNRKISDLNREWENLDVKHADNSEQILGLNDYVKNKALAVEACKERIEESTKKFKDGITMLKELCPMALPLITELENAVKNKDEDGVIRFADSIKTVEQNN